MVEVGAGLQSNHHQRNRRDGTGPSASLLVGCQSHCGNAPFSRLADGPVALPPQSEVIFDRTLNTNIQLRHVPLCPWNPIADLFQKDYIRLINPHFSQQTT